MHKTCDFCGKIQEKSNSAKRKIIERDKARSVREAATFLRDDGNKLISEVDGDGHD